MSSASVVRASARLRATSALAWSRRRSRLPHSGNSCSTVKSILFWRGPLVRSISSDVMRNVGSASEPAISTRACAASVSSARAARSGLRWRAIASTSSSVAPGAAGATGASACADAAMIVASAMSDMGGDREGCRGMLFRLIDESAAHGAGFALHLGAEIKRPLTGHAGLDLKAVKPGLIGRQGAHLAGHLGHSARPHIGLALEQHRAGDRLVIRDMDEANTDVCLPGPGWLCLDQFKAIISGCGEGVAGDQGRGHKVCRADEGARGTMKAHDPIPFCTATESGGRVTPGVAPALKARAAPGLAQPIRSGARRTARTSV